MIIAFALAAVPRGVAQGFELPSYPSVPVFSAVDGFGSGYSFGSTAVPSVFGHGAYGPTPYSGYSGIGGYGSLPYSGYGVAQGRLGRTYQATGSLYQQVYRSTAPQTTVALQPVYDIITSTPGWYRARSTVRRRPRPTVPREELLDDKGAILWPAATPRGQTATEPRRQAEEAVRGVVDRGKQYGHASIRQVIDAKKKLTDFARKALPEVKMRNAADAANLERFIVELEKTLETFAVQY
jgi:hypothetical protein